MLVSWLIDPLTPSQTLLAEALDPETSADRLVALVRDAPGLAWAVAAHPRMSSQRVAAALAELSRWRLSEALRSSRLPLAVLDALARMGGEDIERAVASAAATGDSTLAHLLASGTEVARLSVVYRSTLSAPLLARAAIDPAWRIRARAAQHRMAGPTLLAQLARDSDPEVRHAVVRNPKTPLSVLIACADDDESDVRYAVVTRLTSHDAPGELAVEAALAQRAFDREVIVREAVAAHPSTPAATQLQLARDASVRVRTALAKCPSTTPAALGVLTSDSSVWVRLELVEHRIASAEVLEALANDAAECVQHALAARRMG